MHFFEPRQRLGATADLSGKSESDGRVAVRLERCGTARARLVAADGKSIASFGPAWLIRMVVTPGPHSAVPGQKATALLADSAMLTRIDPMNYKQSPASDSQGRITFPALIPGATYRIIGRPGVRGGTGSQVRREFTVKPGENLDLGDILIEINPVAK